jgi:hypothetical protein
MVGGMFAVIVMNCWGKRFTKVGTRSGLLGIIPWCVMAACSVVLFERQWQWLWHKLDWGFGWRPKSLKNVTHRHPMLHSAHNRPVVWMQTPLRN